MAERTIPAGIAAAADDAFGADVCRLLAQDTTDLVFSPVSVASVLRMALCGARGKTAGELADALQPGSLQPGPVQPGLGIADADLADMAAEELRSVSSVLGGVTAGESATLRAPNTMWVQSGLPLLPGFTGRLSGAGLEAADFAAAPEAARAEINRVIAEQTAGKITGLLPRGTIDLATRLVLASAIYLKASWARPFPEKATSDGPFYPEGPGRPALTVPMMHGTAPRDYLRGDGYQAVLLPYAGARLAMAVVLPDGPLAGAGTLAGAGGGLAGGGLRAMLAGATRHQVTLSLPRFRLESSFSLIPALRHLGVQQAFGDHADFSGITEAERLQISLIVHKAYVDVDEHGTEAAAATAAVIRAAAAMRTPPPVTMTVDRPFLFAIIETGTGLPLFLGQVSHPSSLG